MARNEFDGAKVGALEARWGTRNALTGQKDAHDMRSQHLGNPNEELKAFTPGQLRDKESLVGLSHGTAYKTAKETEAVNKLLQGQKDAFQNVIKQDFMMNVQPQIWAAYDKQFGLGENGKQQILKAIEAKVGKAEQVQTTAMDRVEATAQIQMEATKLLQQAPDGLLLAGGIGLALWVINRLPISGIHKALGLTMILSIVLAACGTAAGTPTPEVPKQGGAVATETAGAPVQGATETKPSATETAAPTATEKVMNVQEQVDAFAAGKIDFPTGMSPEKYSAFIDEMNNHVGRKPIWVESNDGKTNAPVVLYFDTTKNRMVQLPGSYAENKAIIDQNVLEMFVKIAVEPGTGNLQFTNSKGEVVTSPNSAGTDWNLRVDDTNYKDGLIALPTSSQLAKPASDAWWDKVVGGITADGAPADFKITFIPGILMDGTTSEVVSRQGGWNLYPTLDILFIKTYLDQPIYGIRTMVGPGPNTSLGIEGGIIETSAVKRIELRDTGKRGVSNFDVGSVYYVGMPKNQQFMWDKNNMADIDALENTDGKASSFDDAFNQDMPNNGNIILGSSFFIKRK